MEEKPPKVYLLWSFTSFVVAWNCQSGGFIHGSSTVGVGDVSLNIIVNLDVGGLCPLGSCRFVREVFYIKQLKFDIFVKWVKQCHLFRDLHSGVVSERTTTETTHCVGFNVQTDVFTSLTADFIPASVDTVI